MPPKKVVDPPAPSPEKSSKPEFETFDPPPASQACISTEPPDNEVLPSLAEAIAMMAHELKNRDTKKSKIKAKEPGTFDGSEPHQQTLGLLQGSAAELHRYCSNP